MKRFTDIGNTHRIETPEARGAGYRDYHWISPEELIKFARHDPNYGKYFPSIWSKWSPFRIMDDATRSRMQGKGMKIMSAFIASISLSSLLTALWFISSY